MTPLEAHQQRMAEYLRREKLLLDNMRQHLPALKQLLETMNDHWGYRDGVYRFYHGSFKVYGLQRFTTDAVAALSRLAPDGEPLCDMFNEITKAGTGRTFKYEDNQHWVEVTAPIVEAFLHARYFVEMAVKYAEELTEPPQSMPSGWAAVLCLYDLR